MARFAWIQYGSAICENEHITALVAGGTLNWIGAPDGAPDEAGRAESGKTAAEDWVWRGYAGLSHEGRLVKLNHALDSAGPHETAEVAQQKEPRVKSPRPSQASGAAVLTPGDPEDKSPNIAQTVTSQEQVHPTDATVVDPSTTLNGHGSEDTPGKLTLVDPPAAPRAMRARRKAEEIVDGKVERDLTETEPPAADGAQSDAIQAQG